VGSPQTHGLNISGTPAQPLWQGPQPLILLAKSACTRDHAHLWSRFTRGQNPGSDFANNINLYDNVQKEVHDYSAC